MFALTHSIRVSDGWIAWERTALPVAGGIEDQPAKVMEAMALIAREENALIQRAQKEAKAKRQSERNG